MKFAAIVCAACHRAWTVETRHESVTCPRCGQKAELAKRRPIWIGDDVAGAQAALNRHAGGPTVVLQTLAERAEQLPHDSPTMAAASRGKGIVNKSERADAVAAALAQGGPASHSDLLEALLQAGLERGRAEAEIIRMLATDYLMEPRAGRYVVVSH